MAKRDTGLKHHIKSHSHKTKKRLEIKRLRLEDQGKRNMNKG